MICKETDLDPVLVFFLANLSKAPTQPINRRLSTQLKNMFIMEFPHGVNIKKELTT